MPEILTESFCERCGTRYTFESAAPKARLGRFKTLSKGLKNFVLDDATSLDEALASARNDESRESTAQQLDAFHKAFNFCMSCRQYTCANCWNEAEGECLSCSPVAGHGLSAAWASGSATGAPAWPARPAEPAGIEAVAWPTADRLRPEPEAAPVEEPWPLEALAGRALFAEPEPEPEPVAAQPEPEPEPVVARPEPEPEPVAAQPEAEPEPVAIEPELVAEEPVIPAAPAAPEPKPAGPRPSTLEERVAAAAANTADLMALFRPGQNLDDALAAYEASVEAEDKTAPPKRVPPTPEPVAAEEPEPEWPAAEPKPIPWPEAEPEPVYETEPEPEPEPIAWPEPEPEPVAWPEAEPSPVAWATPEPPAPPAEPERPRTPTRPAEDIVQVPTWHVVAPEVPANGHPSEAVRPAARTERQIPEWPGQPAESFLAARLAARKAGDDMWAASSVEVVGPTAEPGAAAQVGVQACVSCGLSLSATARFCRRCGTRQG
jgi:hypothetical protein